MSFDSREYEWADISVSILGKKLTGLRGLTYKKIREKEHVYAAGSDPKTIQRGNKKYDGSLVVLKSDADALNAAARAAGYEDIVEVPGKLLTLTCSFEMEGKIQTATCINCEFTELDDGMKQADKFKEITLPFLFLSLKLS